MRKPHTDRAKHRLPGMAAAAVPIGDQARYAAEHLDGLRGRKALLPRESYLWWHRPPGGGEEGFTLGWGLTHFGAELLQRYGEARW